MQLEFVYKNSGKKYEIVEGANISMSYNEDLSNGVLIIRENEEIDIEPYDEIILYGLDFVEKLYMLVDTYVCKETRNKIGNKIYTYTINIMSQTKLLENKILPSLAITPKTNGGLPIKAYLERYNNLYGQKVRTESGFANKFVFDIGNKFDDVCPELQFNNPTFRECLTQLMMVKNCIPIVQNNVISYIDLSKKQNLLDKNDPHIAYCETSQSSADYTSDLRTSIKNAIQEDDYTSVTEFISFRSENSGRVDTNNLFLYTKFPIYDIESLEIYFGRARYVLKVAMTITTKYYYSHSELTNYYNGHSLVYEKSHWDTLDIVGTMDVDMWENMYKYQNSTIYFTRGSNVIQNFGMTTKLGWILQWENTALYWILNASLRASGIVPSGICQNEFWKYVAFKIKYKTKADIVTNIGKSKSQTTEREVVDNQSDNYINAYTFGLLEHAKVNRLGNKMKTYPARFPRNYADLPTIGDYYEGNEIIYKVDYQIWKNAVDTTIYTCPNYILRNYFNAVHSKLRSWNIVSGGEAFAREENIKYYLEFDYKERKDKLHDISLNTEDFIKYCFGSINDTIIKIPYITAKTTDSQYSDDFVFDTLNSVVGNSLLFVFGYNDNYKIDNYISQIDFEGGMKQMMYSYTSDKGNFTQIRYSLIKKYVSISGLPSENKEVSEDESETISTKIFNYSSVQPKKSFESYSYFLSIARDLYKDNKEIPKINTQFEFCSAEGILLGDEFIKGHKGNGIAKTQLKIRISDEEPIDQTLPDGTDIDISNVVINADSNSSTARMLVNNMPTDKYCYIYNTANNGILLAFKGNELWLNLLKQRNKHIYKRVGNDIIDTGETI